MKKSHTDNMDQTSIISEQSKEVYLDTIQLKTLEDAYREWVEDTIRSDIQISRKRILLIFLLIRYTGAKLNEVLSLEPLQDIDFHRKQIVLKGKKTGSRKVPIPETLADEIQTILSDPGFAESTNNKFSVDPGFVRRKFYERSESCGFDKRLGSPELIRKARGAELLQSNMPLPAVQDLLGHSTPNLTKSMVSFSKKEMQRLTQLFMEQESDRKTSARNAFFGKIIEIEQGCILSRVEMTAIEGFSITAIVTSHSLSQLGLKKGRLVTAEVKAPWVILQKIESDALSCTAENTFEGIITQVNSGKINTEYVVRISDVTEMCAIVTTRSCRQVGLKKGDQVRAMFNSSVVVLHAG